MCKSRMFDMAAKEFKEEMASRLSEFTLDLGTGKASSREVGAWASEGCFGAVAVGVLE